MRKWAELLSVFRAPSQPNPLAPTLILDMDGVLTDGKQYIDVAGEKLFKRFCCRDVAPLREFVARGWRVIVVSADDWRGAREWCDNYGAEFFGGVRDKRAWLLAHPEIRRDGIVAGVEDAWDVLLAEAVIVGGGQVYCPADAAPVVKCIPDVVVLETKGGAGCVAELAQRLFKRPI